MKFVTMQGQVVIGLTGGIASGKSSVGARLRDHHGFRVIDCDLLGHRAYAQGSECFGRVEEAFGADVVAEDGSINRKVLGAKVFGKPDQLKRLTDIVWAEIDRLLALELAAAKDGVVFVEAAVLFEAGWNARCREVLTVAAPEDIAVKRLFARNNLDEAAARARIAAQLSNAERAQRAQLTIENRGSLEELHALVDERVAELKKKYAKL
jgi:phosphopantetheine adenylyltransferase/dephospho-CoA kinase